MNRAELLTAMAELRETHRCQRHQDGGWGCSCGFELPGVWRTEDWWTHFDTEVLNLILVTFINGERQ